MKFARLSGPALLAVLAGQAFAQVQHGTVRVVEVDAGNTAASVSVTRTGGFGVWSLDASLHSRGDYYLNLGAGTDGTTGVLITGAAQLERIEPSVVPTAPAGPGYFCTIQAGLSASNQYFLSSIQAAPGTEANFDANFVYFPNGAGWLAASLYNTANNGQLANLVGNPAIQIRSQESQFTGQGIEVLDFTVGSFANGFYLLSNPGTDFRRDGLLLVTGAKDEDNRAQVFVNYDGTAVINCIDNGSESGGENDPVAFVFIPEGTTGVTMGQVTGSARTLFKQGNFTVEMVGQTALNGTFRITIPGETPASGTLIACPHSELAGTTVDNAVFVQADNDGWLVTTRDTEPYADGGMTLQDISDKDIAFHFAFFKNDATITPGTPARAYLPRLDDVVAARFAVTELSEGNTNGECRSDRAAGSDALDCFGDNKGDFGLSWLGARLSSYTDNSLDTREGVFLASSSQLVRDNSATGGASGWATVSGDNSNVHLHNASIIGGEMNSNYAAAFFPASLGLVQDADVAAELGVLPVAVPGSAASDGVLMAMNWDNNNRVVSVTPNGSQYDITAYAAQSNATDTIGLVATESVEVGYVYMPYNLTGLTAGQIADDGTTLSILSGTSNFTVAAGSDAFGFPITEISITGVDARTDGGTLLVNAITGPWAMSWEPGENGEFEVAGLELLTQLPGRTSFSFAYIPAEGLGLPSIPTCNSIDFNRDGLFPDDGDLIDFLNVQAGGSCSNDPNCDSNDFNNDGLFPDDQDLIDFLTVLAGGTPASCTP